MAPPVLADENLVAAMDHPARAHIMGVLSHRVASPAEIARELSCDTNYLAYHIRRLKELGLIELARVERTPGGRITGRYYRATARSWIDAENWKKVPLENQHAVTATVLATCNADLRAAVTAGTIHGEDNVIARIPLAVDRKGYDELVELLNETTERVVNVQERSAARMRRDDETLLVKVHIVQFESPDPVD
ncbi:MAG TPA: winged helix-turn-helix domain-containing protein [Solirubrobacterales bacterium]